MAQVQTKSIGILKYMQSKSFAEGFREAREGKPFNYDRVTLKDDWGYEAGRQFAFIYFGKLKDGNTINRYAARELSVALRNSHVMA